MDDARFGRAIRAIRVKARLRQADIATRSGLSQAAVSDIERGRADRLSIRTLRSVAAALGAEVGLDVRWRGGEVDRLLDEGHAALVASATRVLEASGWDVIVEATYSRYGERGSFDILGLHRRTGMALAVEVKTRLISLEATLRKLDEKARIAPLVATERFGGRPRGRGRMLVLPRGGVSQRAVARHDSILGLACPLRGAAARAWLADPTSEAGVLLLLSPSGTPRVDGRRARTGPSQAPRIAPGTTARPRAGDPALSAPDQGDEMRRDLLSGDAWRGRADRQSQG